MIPEAAVEAVYALLPDDALRHVNKARVKVMLEAAVPHMLTQALNAALDAVEYEDGSKPVDARNLGPYRIIK